MPLLAPCTSIVCRRIRRQKIHRHKINKNELKNWQQKELWKPSVVVWSFTARTQEAEVAGTLRVRGQPSIVRSRLISATQLDLSLKKKNLQDIFKNYVSRANYQIL